MTRLALPASVPGRVMLGVRFACGAASWFAPKSTMRLLGMEPDRAPETIYVGRLFGTRDAVLGAGLLAARGEARRRWWLLGIACDVSDALAGIVGARRNQLPKNAAVRTLLISAGVVGAGLGAWALAAEDL